MLTPAQKISAYEYALDNHMKGERDAGICWFLSSWLFLKAPHVFKESVVSGTLAAIFPEFYAQRPYGSKAYWWPLDESGRLIRIDVLTKAIANVKP